eukprot:gene23680-biopygen23846
MLESEYGCSSEHPPGGLLSPSPRGGVRHAIVPAKSVAFWIHSPPSPHRPTQSQTEIDSGKTAQYDTPGDARAFKPLKRREFTPAAGSVVGASLRGRIAADLCILVPAQALFCHQRSRPVDATLPWALHRACCRGDRHPTAVRGQMGKQPEGHYCFLVRLNTWGTNREPPAAGGGNVAFAGGGGHGGGGVVKDGGDESARRIVAAPPAGVAGRVLERNGALAMAVDLHDGRRCTPRCLPSSAHRSVTQAFRTQLLYGVQTQPFEIQCTENIPACTERPMTPWLFNGHFRSRGTQLTTTDEVAQRPADEGAHRPADEGALRHGCS